MTCECGAHLTDADVFDPAYACRNGHYFTRPEAGDSNICPECSRAGKRIGVACPECREPLTCDGSSECKATRHLHGCFADRGECDEPTEHRAVTIIATDEREAAA